MSDLVPASRLRQDVRWERLEWNKCQSLVVSRLTRAGTGGSMLDVMPNGTGRRADRPRLDEVDRKLLLALSQDGRRPAAALAKELGLSRQAITERLRDLET